MAKPEKIKRALNRGSIRSNSGDLLSFGGNPRSGYAGQTSNTYHSRLWSQVGYPCNVTFGDLYGMFDRFGIATAGVNLIVNEGWSEYPTIKDENKTDEKTETEFEKVTNAFFSDRNAYAALKGADWRNRIGEYSGFMIQIKSNERDEIDWSKPLDQIKLEQIVRFIPVNQGQLIPGSFYPENNINYPNPETYTFNESSYNGKNSQGNTIERSFTVHASRVIIFAEGADDGTIHGRPCNRSGFNALLDMEKISASGGEGFFQAVIQRLLFQNKTGVTPPKGKEEQSVSEMMDTYFKNMNQGMLVGGWDIKQLDNNLPSNYKDPFFTPLYIYCASINVPATVLIGQMTGRLASDEDQKQMAKNINERRNGWQTEMIGKLIDWLDIHCTDYIKSDDYEVCWPDAGESSFSDKVDTVDKLASAIDKFNSARMKGKTVISEDELREVIGFEPLEVSIDTADMRTDVPTE